MASIFQVCQSFLPNDRSRAVIVGIVLAALAAILHWSRTSANHPPVLQHFPVVALTERALGPKQSWRQASNETLAKGLKVYPGPFQILTGTGPKLILPNRFAEQLRYRRDLDLLKASVREFPTSYPGFEAFKTAVDYPHVVGDAIRVKLNQSLDFITHDLVDEGNAAIARVFGDSQDWHSTLVKDNTLDVITQMSSRIFLGTELCRDRAWINIAKNYTIDSFVTAFTLRFVPPLMRPLLYWLNPYSYKLRAHVRNARKLITPVINRCRAEMQQADQVPIQENKRQRMDAIRWMLEVDDDKPDKNRREVDFVAAQLSLTLAATYTTTEALATALIDLCEHPTVIDDLRKEIVEVISAHGWSKAAVQKLGRMDSFLKESQRFHPPALVTMHRYVERDFELSDGSQIPAGTILAVACAFSDPDVYKDPGTFKAFRFFDEQPQDLKASTWSHVSIQPAHMAFGYGKHACPGRFFASHEIKVTLCLLLLKYDWKISDDCKPAFTSFETMTVSDPKTKLLFRRRREEIKLDLLD